jgi:hypothetical protein
MWNFKWDKVIEAIGGTLNPIILLWNAVLMSGIIFTGRIYLNLFYASWIFNFILMNGVSEEVEQQEGLVLYKG